MKKFLTVFTAIAMCSVVANAQVDQTSTEKTQNQVQQKRSAMRERFENASTEQKQHMIEMKKKFDSLTPEQKEAVKKERERHRQEMKRITGFDDMMPPMPGREDNFKERR